MSILNNVYNSLLNKFYGFNKETGAKDDLTLFIVNNIFNLQDECVKEELNTTLKLNKNNKESKWLFS
jgi:hypothetical protein